jgi:hypothetical protein
MAQQDGSVLEEITSANLVHVAIEIGEALFFSPAIFHAHANKGCPFFHAAHVQSFRPPG